MMKTTIGSKIVKLRKEKGMTQAQLADKMGVTDKAVSKWERNLSYPDVQSIPKLAQILGVSIEEFMQDENQKEEGKQQPKELHKLILKATSLAMGIAVVVLTILDELDIKSGMLMLGIGISAIAILLLQDHGKV